MDPPSTRSPASWRDSSASFRPRSRWKISCWRPPETSPLGDLGSPHVGAVLDDLELEAARRLGGFEHVVHARRIVVDGQVELRARDQRAVGAEDRVEPIARLDLAHVERTLAGTDRGTAPEAAARRRPPGPALE